MSFYFCHSDLLLTECLIFSTLLTLTVSKVCSLIFLLIYLAVLLSHMLTISSRVYLHMNAVFYYVTTSHAVVANYRGCPPRSHVTGGHVLSEKVKCTGRWSLSFPYDANSVVVAYPCTLSWLRRIFLFSFFHHIV